MKQEIKAIGWYLLLVMIWEFLELAIYGEVQPRIVDDIMSVLYFVFIYQAMKQGQENFEMKIDFGRICFEPDYWNGGEVWKQLSIL